MAMLSVLHGVLWIFKNRAWSRADAYRENSARVWCGLEMKTARFGEIVSRTLGLLS